MNYSRKVIIIAGPNGAGKTTFAREFLPNEAGCPVFVNADLIAAGLAPFAPDSAALQAGRLMLQELARHFAAGQSFAFETTLAGRGYVQHIKVWQAAGYRVKLIYLRLGTAEQAIARVKVGTLFPKRRFDAALLPACGTSSVSMRPWSMLGHCMTTRAPHRC